MARRRSPPGILLILALLSLAGWPPVASAVVDTGRPLPEAGPTAVSVDIIVLDLDAIDSAAQSFQANVVYRAAWKDPRLADPSRTASIQRPLDEVWHPRFQILNRQRVWSSLPDVVEIAPDGTVILRARVWGDFSQPLDLREFPFDGQTITLPVVAAGYTRDQVALSTGERSGLDESFSLPDWRVLDWRMTQEIDMAGSLVAVVNPTITMVIEVERLGGYYWIKVIAPLILIVAMSWTVNWIDPKEISTKISITITAMLTLIAYRFAIGANLPHISYLTRLDLFILFSTLLIYASLVTVVVTTAFNAKGRPALAKHIDRVSRWGFPLFFLGAGLVSRFLPI